MSPPNGWGSVRAARHGILLLKKLFLRKNRLRVQECVRERDEASR